MSTPRITRRRAAASPQRPTPRSRSRSAAKASTSGSRKKRAGSMKKGNKKVSSPAQSQRKSSQAATRRRQPTKNETTKEVEGQGQNWVEGGIDNNPYMFALICFAPLIAQLLAYVTSSAMQGEPFLANMVPSCAADLSACGVTLLQAAFHYKPSWLAAQFLASFVGVGLVLELLPGKIQRGPETLTGHVPEYKDNGVLFFIFFTIAFWAGSNLGPGKIYDFGIMYDVFPQSVTILNLFGILFAGFLMLKGLHFPSTKDSGSSGSLVRDYMWGTELYPRICGLDLKRFVNCRFSMMFWQLAGLSFAYRSFTLHGQWDYGLLFSAISQYLYLGKFFWWEMGYMRSIDIIVDRAGFEIQWGCLVWVPSVYTFHSRFCVLRPSQISFYPALALFLLSMAGVVLNYLADAQRDSFRACDGKCLIWGKQPRFIKASYSVLDPKTGVKVQRRSLLLASGFWGVARHFQYLWELVAAWSWCFLANPFVNGLLPLYYAAFLSYLLFDRAERDSKKCHMKYGKYYAEYCKLVPYKIVPGVY